MQTGDTCSWHIRPEVHVDHGGYLKTEPLTGTIRSVHRGHFMVGTGRMVHGRAGFREMTYSVSRSNPSLRKTDEPTTIIYPWHT